MEFTKLIFIDDRVGTEEKIADKTVSNPSILPIVGDRVNIDNKEPWPKIANRHLDYDAKICYLYMR